jgi:hypothetical protein
LQLKLECKDEKLLLNNSSLFCVWAAVCEPCQAKLSLSLNAPEYLENSKKNSIVIVKILMLYLIINNLWVEEGEFEVRAGGGGNQPIMSYMYIHTVHYTLLVRKFMATYMPF